MPIVLMALTSRTREHPGAPLAPLGALIATGAVQWYPWILIVPLIDRRVRGARPASRRDAARIAGAHALQWLLFGLAHGALIAAATATFFPAETARSMDAVSQLVPDAVLYGAVLGGFTIAEARRRQTETAERLRVEVAEARLDALRQQLNPHFLFNALNHIVMELRTGRAAPAERMLLSLSELLRDVLRDRTQLIPLADEVRMLERYLDIERARFGDRLQVRVTFEPRTLTALVPSLMLQPLVENALRHGVSTADGACRLAVAARVDGTRLLLAVRDEGPGLSKAADREDAGVGLRNTGERLKYLYGTDHTLELKASESGGLLVSIDLPFRRA